MPFDSKPMPGFNAAQLKISGNYFEREAALVLRDTIGNGWNVRQRHLITVFGAQELERKNGGQVADLRVGEWEQDLMVEFDRTTPIVRKDIQELIDYGVLRKVYMEGSNKKKTLRMTEDGYEDWVAYNDQMTALFLATADGIREAGQVPVGWIDRIKTMTRNFLRGVSGLGLAVALAGGVASATAPSAQASDLRELGLVTSLLPYAESGMIAPKFNGADVTVAKGIGVKFRDNSFGWMSATPYAPDLMTTGAPKIILSDGASFLDKHLPKNRLIDWDWNDEAGGMVFRTALKASKQSKAPDLGTDVWQAAVAATQKALADGTVKSGLDYWPVSWPEETLRADGASFLDKHLPKLRESGTPVGIGADMGYGKLVF